MTTNSVTMNYEKSYKREAIDEKVIKLVFKTQDKMQSIFVALCIVGAVGAVAHDWVNDFDKPFTFSCTPGKMIGSLYSVHSNLHEDRRWKIGCWRNTPVASRWWSPAINFHREYFVFVCPFQSALSGMAGFHSNKFEDRRFRFHCTQRKFNRTRRCWWSSYLNRFDGVFRFVTPRGTYISGVKAQYSRFHKDRRFAIRSCRLY